MESSGGLDLTDRKEPTYTVAAAVAIMLNVTGTGRNSGASARTKSATCSQGHGGFGTSSSVMLISAMVPAGRAERERGGLCCTYLFTSFNTDVFQFLL